MSSPPRIVFTTPKIYPVSAVADAIKRMLASAPDGWVEGEVRQLNVHAKSGHCYLTLADEDASLDAIIWRGSLADCRPLPQAGDLVHAHYRGINFYPPTGKTSLIIDELKATGEGELLRRRQQTLTQLQADGLCDEERRKPLPAFPRRVGVIAGQDSDAKTDVIRALRTRFRPQDILFAPSLVQGVGAVGGVIDALGRLQDQPGIDVIILARGGGSVADLAAFDDERLCRAIFACAVPVITSIGHTKDRPNCDHVAAAYAPVPATAAELAIRYSADELLAELARYHDQSGRAGVAGVQLRAAQLQQLSEQLCETPGLRHYASELAHIRDSLVTRPRLLLQQWEGERASLSSKLAALLVAATRQLPRVEALDVCATQLQAARAQFEGRIYGYQRSLVRLHQLGARDVRRQLSLAQERLRQALALLEAKDFRGRGYALITDERGKAIKRVTDLHTGQHVKLRFTDGEADTVITNTHQGVS